MPETQLLAVIYGLCHGHIEGLTPIKKWILFWPVQFFTKKVLTAFVSFGGSFSLLHSVYDIIDLNAFSNFQLFA